MIIIIFFFVECFCFSSVSSRRRYDYLYTVDQLTELLLFWMGAMCGALIIEKRDLYFFFVLPVYIFIGSSGPDEKVEVGV